MIDGMSSRRSGCPNKGSPNALARIERRTTSGNAIEYSYVARLLYALHERLDIRALALDRYNMKHLRPWLIEAGFSDYELERLVDFGQGFVSMSPALRELET